MTPHHELYAAFNFSIDYLLVNKIKFFRDSGGVGVCSCLRMASGEAFGWPLEAVLGGQSDFFAVLFVVWRLIFRLLRNTSVLVALCGRHMHLKHLAAQPNVSTTS